MNESGSIFDQTFIKQLANEVATFVVARLPKQAVPQRYFTMEQAAAYMGHTKKSFEYLRSKDLFPVIRRDRLVLFDREDLDRVMMRLKQ